MNKHEGIDAMGVALVVVSSGRKIDRYLVVAI